MVPQRMLPLQRCASSTSNTLAKVLECSMGLPESRTFTNTVCLGIATFAKLATSRNINKIDQAGAADNFSNRPKCYQNPSSVHVRLELHHGRVEVEGMFSRSRT